MTEHEIAAMLELENRATLYGRRATGLKLMRRLRIEARAILTEVLELRARIAELETELARAGGHVKALKLTLEERDEKLAAREADVRRYRETAENYLDAIIKLDADIERLEAERDTLKAELEKVKVETSEQLEFDRTKLAEFVTRFDKVLDSRFWLTEGRGCYEWDDDRYRQEFHDAAIAIRDALVPIRSIAANRGFCPKTTEEVIKSRIDLKGQVSALRDQNAALVEALDVVSAFWLDNSMLDALDDDLGSGIRYCLPCVTPRIRDIRKFREALSPTAAAEWRKRVNAEGAAEELGSLQKRVADWVISRIGADHMNSRERAMRLFEEAAELLQAEGVTREIAEKQIAYVFERPVGIPAKEAGGVAVCLLGWCEASGVNVLDVATVEVERIEAKSVESIRGSVARKADQDLVVVAEAAKLREEKGGRA